MIPCSTISNFICLFHKTLSNHYTLKTTPSTLQKLLYSIVVILNKLGSLFTDEETETERGHNLHSREAAQSEVKSRQSGARVHVLNHHAMQLSEPLIIIELVYAKHIQSYLILRITPGTGEN